MPEPAGKDCLVAIDCPQGPLLVPVALPAAATVASALAQARSQIMQAGVDAVADWDRAATGIWGVRCERSTVPRAGDRIELYRPLELDPRRSRRQRAGRAPRRRTGPSRPGR